MPSFGTSSNGDAVVSDEPTVVKNEFDFKRAFLTLTQMAYYLIVMICVLFTFVTFTMMALYDGVVTMDSNAYGEMWYEIGFLSITALLGSYYLWSKVEDKKLRPILALLVLAGFLFGASAMLTTFTLLG